MRLSWQIKVATGDAQPAIDVDLPAKVEHRGGRRVEAVRSADPATERQTATVAVVTLAGATRDVPAARTIVVGDAGVSGPIGVVTPGGIAMTTATAGDGKMMTDRPFVSCQRAPTGGDDWPGKVPTPPAVTTAGENLKSYATSVSPITTPWLGIESTVGAPLLLGIVPAVRLASRFASRTPRSAGSHSPNATECRTASATQLRPSKTNVSTMSARSWPRSSSGTRACQSFTNYMASRCIALEGGDRQSANSKPSP